MRIGYSSSELYLWYDTNTQAPNVNIGDNAAVYLDTTTGGGSVLSGNSYKFQAAVNGYKKRNNYQQAYSGNGTARNAAGIPFAAVYGWRGHGLNGPQDSGWSMTYHLPFSSLGLTGSPAQGALWKLAVKVHNQDDAASTPYTVRNGLSNQVVTDAMVGGGLSCGNRGLNRWTQWGTQTYAGAAQINIQNESDISDWNCFSKFYIAFPLGSLPTGQGVVSARVTLYE